MKKMICLILAFLLCLSCCACGETGAAATTEPEISDPAANAPSALLPFLDELYGKWTLSSTEVTEQNPYTAIEVRKDGTCVVDGIECTWQIDSKSSNNSNLLIKIYRGAEHIGGAQVSTSADRSVYYFRAMDLPFIFCPGVWKKGQ